VPNHNLTEVELQQRKADVIDMKHEGYTFAQIGERFDVEARTANRIYWQALEEIVAPGVHALRAKQNGELDAVKQQMFEILNSTHYAKSGGKLVLDTDGNAMHDDSPRIQAAAVIARIIEQQARLNGTQAPVQVSINGEIRFEVAGVDMAALR
jgi:hypothetical protein